MFIKFEIANYGFMSLKKIYGKKVFKSLARKRKEKMFL